MAILKRVSKRTGKASWQVLIDRRDSVTGERKRVTVGTFRTKRDAEKAERDAMTQRDRGTLVDPSTATVAEVLDRYLEVEMPKTVRPENRQEYVIIVKKHVKPAVGHHRVQRLTAEHVDAFYADLIARGYSASLIRKCHQRLSTALRMAVRWQIVSRNVCDAVAPPRMTTKLPKIWTPEEAATFLATARAGEEALLAYWTLMLDTGARTSELLGVTWADIDFDNGTVRLGEHAVRMQAGTPVVKVGGKTESAARTVRITAGTTTLLKQHRKRWLAQKTTASEWQNAHDLVFVSASGRPLNARNVRRAFDRVIRRAGVPAISPHGVRKTSITCAIAAGAPLKAVAARHGHRDISTTLKTYTALTRGQEDQLLDVLEALMTAAPTHQERDAG